MASLTEFSQNWFRFCRSHQPNDSIDCCWSCRSHLPNPSAAIHHFRSCLFFNLHRLGDKLQIHRSHRLGKITLTMADPFDRIHYKGYWDANSLVSRSGENYWWMNFRSHKPTDLIRQLNFTYHELLLSVWRFVGFTRGRRPSVAISSGTIADDRQRARLDTSLCW